MVLNVQTVHRSASATACTLVIHLEVSVGSANRCVQRACGCLGLSEVHEYITATRISNINLVHILDEPVAELKIV